jgi:MFS family permease
MLAAAPTARWSYGIILLPVGAAVVLFSTSANTLVQLAATDVVRGRVLSVYLLVFLGSGALGGPLVGAIDQHLGPRTGLFLAGVVSVAATVAVRIVRRAAPAAADTDRPPQRAPLGQVR